MAEFSQTIFDAICDRIANGESLRSICKSEGMPNHRDVTRWLDKNPDIVPQYARAREIQADKLFEECLEIADQYDQSAENEEGGTDHINRARLRIDTRKWMAGKLRPKVYGDKLDIGGNVGITVILDQDAEKL